MWFLLFVGLVLLDIFANSGKVVKSIFVFLASKIK